MRNQREGSSCFGFDRVISSRIITASPFFRCPTISLLILAWPRIFTLGCLATAGSGLKIGSALGCAFFVAAGWLAPLVETGFFASDFVAAAGALVVAAGGTSANARSIRKLVASAATTMERNEIF